MTGKSTQKEFGDYQTPISFAEQVCELVSEYVTDSPSTILEPTFGLGNFLIACSTIFKNARLYGIEINEAYYQHAKGALGGNSAELYNADFFSFNFKPIINSLSKNEKLLIIGNPPWVTNSTVSQLEGGNLPQKSNFKELSGLDAITGNANFDICEYILLDLAHRFKSFSTTVAVLCKTSVARKTYCELMRSKVKLSKATIYKFDAKRMFNVSVDSCLFTFSICQEECGESLLHTSLFSNPASKRASYSYTDGKLVPVKEKTTALGEGECEFVWRQGVKHDCSKVMEARIINGQLLNGYQEALDIEDQYVFPLIKSSGIKSYIISDTDRRVIVTQKKANSETSSIRFKAPRTWDYLQIHADDFLRRKSSIYHNAPIFGMFGVGDYSYSPYKVGISGFYKNPRFALLSGNRPIMMDDTCYFLSFQHYSHAYIALLILNSDLVQNFLKSIVFLDSKRPYTKKVLQRIEFAKCLKHLCLLDLIHTERKLNLPRRVKQSYIDDFKVLLQGGHSFAENPQMVLSL